MCRERRFASSRIAIPGVTFWCLILDEVVPFLFLFLAILPLFSRFIPLGKLRLKLELLIFSLPLPLPPSSPQLQKKSKANSESDKIKTRLRNFGGTTCKARRIPNEMAATSLDFLAGTVLRAIVSMRSSDCKRSFVVVIAADDGIGIGKKPRHTAYHSQNRRDSVVFGSTPSSGGVTRYDEKGVVVF
ncbi:hypothetical protein ACHAXS_010572 [Conticribra weissflogii]